jgi:dinuclear metal center YbgI/SA1388 family protein
VSGEVTHTDLTVGALERLLDERFPYAWAEPWDRVGLLVGDRDAQVTKVFVSLDPTRGALTRAACAGANVLLTHHPAFLEPLSELTADGGPGSIALHAAAMGIALVACHTNLDRAPAGAAALPRAVGLTPGPPLEHGRQPVALVTLYAPGHAVPALIQQMAAAGAGRVGEYRACAFGAPGTGSYVAGQDTNPVIGRPGDATSAEEVRLEMVCPPGNTSRVIDAARRAHPYEEPLIVVGEASIDRGVARLGRLCALPEPTTLGEFATRVSSALGVRPKVWGGTQAPVTLVATSSGSGGSVVDAAIAAGASVLLTGEVRYHVALDALAAGLAVIEAGHDVTEWPHVRVLADTLLREESLADCVVADQPVRRWWTP